MDFRTLFGKAWRRILHDLARSGRARERKRNARIRKRGEETRLENLGQFLRDRRDMAFKPSKTGKFILLAQGRTGSTLIESLIASHPRVHRSTEVLGKRRRKISLLAFVEAASRRSQSEIYGFKAKVYQLSGRQGVDPKEFLETLHRRGWKIIYLRRRDLLRQSVSHFIRLHRGEAHNLGQEPETVRLEIPPAKLLRQLRGKQKALEDEAVALGSLPRLELVYEDDLEDPALHQATADRVFAFLGVDSRPVETRLRKITAQPIDETVENWSEIEEAVTATEFRVFLPKRSGTPVEANPAAPTAPASA